MNRNFRTPDQVEDRDAVRGCRGQRRIAEDRGYANKVNFRVERREHQRDGVIRPRVAVNDQAVFAHRWSMRHPASWQLGRRTL